MDGARRVLRSLTGLSPTANALAYARADFGSSFTARPRSRRPARAGALTRFFAHPLLTSALICAFLGGAFAFSVTRSGAYGRFIQEVGTPGDILARALGLGVRQVTITGIAELKEAEILAYAGVKARNSLPFLDATAMRDRLRSAALVKDAEIRKLYPNRLAIAIVERQPFALWQNNGRIDIVSAEGVAIDEMRDDRFARLPLIVGAGANERIGEYTAIMAAAGDLAGRIKAATLVSGRRWTLHLTDGIEIKLPERNPAAAVTQLQKFQRDHRVLDKDVVALDLRAPGRVVVRLSEEAAAHRLEALSRTTKGKAS